MKSFLFSSAALLILTFNGLAQRNADPGRLGLPGDNFNLAAAMDIFQKSPTLEEFEKNLNLEDKRVNNLDLNNDGQTDYIKVLTYQKDNLHTIVLQVDLSRNESQDIAVIYVEKKGENVTIQMIGDEELYGKEYIIEPATSRSSAGTPNPGYQGDGTTVIVNNTTTNNYYNSNNTNYAPQPAYWPIVTYMYSPVYNPWYSPWYWGYYPRWWRPWRPFFWDDYYYYWYHTHSWYGWWYYRPPVFYFGGPHVSFYFMKKKSSPMFAQYKTQGMYNKVYDNPKPNANVSVKTPPPSYPTKPAQPVDGKNNGRNLKEGDLQKQPLNKEQTSPRPKPQTREPEKSRPQMQPQQRPSQQPSKPNYQQQPSKPQNQNIRPTNQNPSRQMNPGGSSGPSRSPGNARPAGGGRK
ncbi:MAG: hypothetical protein MH137_05255 [Flavobacteriales bacterium]|nr:hypothetical protein [Flavobacteriales bacterium]